MKKITPPLFPTFLLIILLPYSNVGTTAPPQARIIGGERSNIDAWPWMAGLVKKKLRTFDGTYCGASLVAKQWALTAAHCVAKYSPEDLDIIVNKAHLNSASGERTEVEQIIIHPLFDSNTLNNDLALVKLSTPSIYTPITLLPTHSGETDSNTAVTAIGWGTTSATKNLFPEALHQVDLSLISDKQCTAVYDNLTGNMICTDAFLEKKDTCQGDSGGPLIIFDTESQSWRQVGITSWGRGCALDGFYGVYTRIQNYISFISDTICSADEIPDTPSLTLTLTGNIVEASWDASTDNDNYRLSFAPFPEGHPIKSIDLNNLTHLSRSLGSNAAFYVGITRYKNNCNSEMSNIEHFIFNKSPQEQNATSK